MKIALVGNLNNNFSSIARYLIDEGYEVFLYRYTNEPDHFSPEQDMFDNVLSGRVKVLPFYKSIDIFNPSIKKLKEEFISYDLVIGCGFLPAWFHKISLRLDVFIPYGSDIYDLPNFKLCFNPRYLLGNFLFSKHQRKGIRAAKYVFLETQSEETERTIQQIGLSGERFLSSIPMLHAPTYENIAPYKLKDLTYYNEYRSLREQSDFIIFHHSRHSWDNPADLNEQKGNNKLFEGFANFLKANPSSRAIIVTIEYGADVQKSKDLIKLLGLSEKVFWLPKQSRRELIVGIQHADLVVGELHGDYNLYGTVIEALICGKPIVQYRTEEKHLSSYDGNLHYAFIANSADSVFSSLQTYYSNREFYNSKSIEGKRWYETHIVNPFLNRINEIISNNSEERNNTK